MIFSIYNIGYIGIFFHIILKLINVIFDYFKTAKSGAKNLHS
jgi:hypothetical protein